MKGMGEFREQWRPLAASFIGISAALSLNPYILSTFAPYLIEDLGWTRAQWALMGIPQLLVLICIPVAGRLTDSYGVRPVVMVGAISFPLFCVAISMMNGDIAVYLAIYIAQTILGSTTTSAVYSRLAAENFTVRRGLALAICGASPALVAMVGSPLISEFVAQHGWRAGYLVVAAYSALTSAVAIALMPRPAPRPPRPGGNAARANSGIYRELMRQPAFWLMLAGSFLVNVPHALATSQLKMVVLEQGATAAQAGLLVSVFAIGVTVGRFVSGLALDSFPAHVVAAIGFGLPLPGLLILASSLDGMPYLVTAILFLGMSFGSEGDVIAYLAVRYFGISIFGSAMGLLTAAMGGAMAMGSLLLGVLLERTDSFDLYLLLASVAVTIGSAMFWSLGLSRFSPDESRIAAMAKRQDEAGRAPAAG